MFFFPVLYQYNIIRRESVLKKPKTQINSDNFAVVVQRQLRLVLSIFLCTLLYISAKDVSFLFYFGLNFEKTKKKKIVYFLRKRQISKPFSHY